MASTLTAKCELREGLGDVPEGFMFDGWRDSELARSRPFGYWLSVQHEALREPHVQIRVYDGDYLVGACVLVDTLDAQVGPALLAWHQWMRPEYRGGLVWRYIIKHAIRYCKDAGVDWLIWTHRDEKSGRIYQTYKEI